jgi:hypothetical protein
MIKWYPDKSHSTTKWPYLMLSNQLDIAGNIAIKRAGSTEKELDLVDYSGNIDLPDSIDKNLHKTFDKIKLSLSISLISPEDENFSDVCQSENDVSILFNLNCDRTNMQINKTVDFVSPITHYEIEIPRNELYGELDLEVFGILNTDYDTDEDDVAYKKGSVIATSIPVRIITDYVGGLFGGRIKEKFEKFDNNKKNALYHFEFQDELPVIIYNNRFKNFIELIKQNTKEGNSQTLFRDFILRSFISQIYYDLAGRLEQDSDHDYISESLEYKVAKSVGKQLKKKRIQEILDFTKGTQELEDTNDVSSLLQHSFKLGPALEKALENNQDETE